MLNCRILIRLVALLALFVSFGTAKRDHQNQNSESNTRLLKRMAESVTDEPTVKRLALARTKKSATELICSSRLNSMAIEFNRQRMRNWKCSLMSNREPSARKRADSSSSTDSVGFCSCHHDYECTEIEQYFFDYLSVTEKLTVNNTVDMNAYSNYCERAMLEATRLSWTCQIDEEILNNIDYFYNYGDSDNKHLLAANSHVNEAYCECSLEKKCKLHRIVSPAPSVSM